MKIDVVVVVVVVVVVEKNDLLATFPTAARHPRGGG